MKILMLADLHGHEPWYEWVLAQAPGHDLICIGGDLIEMFGEKSVLPQIHFLADWMRRYQHCGKPIVFCSGNHDPVPRNIQRQACPDVPGGNQTTTEWINALGYVKTCPFVGDGECRPVIIGSGQVLVTTFPYNHDGSKELVSRIKGLWNQGAAMKRQLNVPWIVLHHNPPAGTPLAANLGLTGLDYQIQESKPDYVLCGHIHGAPFTKNGSFSHRIGSSWCFNPGRVANGFPFAAEPNRIEVDTDQDIARWTYFNPKMEQQQKEIRLRGDIA